VTYVTSTMRANLWWLPIPAGAPVDIAAARALTSSNQVIESMSVSRDRKWLIFDSTLHLNAEILRMPIGGGPTERLTTNAFEDFAPDLSPDGKTLAYQSWRNGTRDIYIQPIGSSVAQALTDTPGQESYPRWSPDGKAISFVDQTGFAKEVVHGKLFVIRQHPDGAWSVPALIFNGATTQGRWVRRPEGDRLAYASMGSVVLIDPDTQKFRVLYQPNGPDDPIAWSVVVSDDERTLYFKSGDTSGQTTIWSLPIEGGRPKLLVRFQDPNRQSIRPDFNAAAGRFFFTIEDRQADIWVATVARK
jgi:Tol biopolymer transport system component